jgi:hypothetical protein
MESCGGKSKVAADRGLGQNPAPARRSGRRLMMTSGAATDENIRSGYRRAPRPRRIVAPHSSASARFAFRCANGVASGEIRGSMAGPYAPLPTLRRHPRRRLRTARGRRGLLLLQRSGLAPPTPCRSPGALRRRSGCVKFIAAGCSVASILTGHGCFTYDHMSIYALLCERCLDKIKAEEGGGKRGGESVRFQ